MGLLESLGLLKIMYVRIYVLTVMYGTVQKGNDNFV